MGMQVTSLSAGTNITVPPQQDFPLDNRPSPQGDRKTAPAQAAPLPGSRKTPGLEKTASDLEQVSLAFDRRLQFVIDQQSRDILIKVIDNETDKVIKVLPPEELQRLHSRIKETMGFLFDKMV